MPALRDSSLPAHGAPARAPRLDGDKAADLRHLQELLAVNAGGAPAILLAIAAHMMLEGDRTAMISFSLAVRSAAGDVEDGLAQFAFAHCHRVADMLLGRALRLPA